MNTPVAPPFSSEADWAGLSLSVVTAQETAPCCTHREQCFWQAVPLSAVFTASAALGFSLDRLKDLSLELGKDVSEPPAALLGCGVGARENSKLRCQLSSNVWVPFESSFNP